MKKGSSEYGFDRIQRGMRPTGSGNMDGIIRTESTGVEERPSGSEQWSNAINKVRLERMALIGAMLDGVDVGERVDEAPIMDIETSDLTLAETMVLVAMAQGRWPLHEVFLDGDRYAVVLRRRP